MDFLSGVDTGKLSDQLKRTYVDCYRQDTGGEEIPILLRRLATEIVDRIIPGKIIPAGSRAEGTMTPSYTGPNCSYNADSDFLYQMDSRALNANITPVSTKNSGFVQLEVAISEDIHWLVKSSIQKGNEKIRISPQKFKSEFQNAILINVFLADSCFPEILNSFMGWKLSTKIVGPSIRLICDPLDEEFEQPEIFVHWPEDDPDIENHRNPPGMREAEIDLVPAIAFQNWPEQAAGWQERERQWPEKALVDQIVQCGYHVVAKPSSSEMEEVEWRVSFSYVEGILLRSIPNNSYCKQCYRIFKCFMKYHLSHPKVISTYHCKTIFLWSLEKCKPDMWDEANLGERFLGLLDHLLHALLNKRLPQYFIISENLFSKLDDDFALTVAQMVSKMRKNPFNFIYRADIVPWDDQFQGMTIDEMLNWDQESYEKSSKENIVYSRVP